MAVCPACGGDKSVLVPTRPGMAKARLECQACAGTGVEPESVEEAVEEDEEEGLAHTMPKKRKKPRP